MGGGTWTVDSFCSYTDSKFKSRGLDVSYTSMGAIDTNFSNQEMFTSRKVDDALNPYKVVRECRDSEEHPWTIPIILALDVTGSMGQSAVEVAKKLNPIMTSLYERIADVEFCIMGIGDLAFDSGPIQISQFESDIRIAEQLDKIWFEFGGGGNYFESYTSAWYMGSRHCQLDCWKRGEKGIIITIGDERLNPYLPQNPLNHVTGDTLQADVETNVLYEEVTQKFAVYHIQVNHNRYYFDNEIEHIRNSFKLLGENYKEANMDDIADTIVDIILNSDTSQDMDYVQQTTATDGIAW